MQTQTAIPSPQPLPPLVNLNRLLLTETCSVTQSSTSENLAPHVLTIRATKISVLLQDMLNEKGYWHGGIND